MIVAERQGLLGYSFYDFAPHLRASYPDLFGEMTNEKLFDIKDVTALEFFILGLLAISALGLGVFPSLVFDLTEGSTNEVLRMIGQ